MIHGLINIHKLPANDDWQKSGYSKNIVTGAPITRNKNLYPFFATYGSELSSVNITSFDLIHIDRSGNECTNYSLETSLLNINVTDTRIYLEYDGKTDILSTLPYYQAGLYQYRIRLDNGVNFQSDPFYVKNNDFSKLFPYVGDFSRDDFSNLDFK